MSLNIIQSYHLRSHASHLQYDWDGPTHLWDALRSDFIDWRYTAPDVGNDTLTMDYVAEHNNETEYYDFFVHQVRHEG